MFLFHKEKKMTVSSDNASAPPRSNQTSRMQGVSFSWTGQSEQTILFKQIFIPNITSQLTVKYKKPNLSN